MDRTLWELKLAPLDKRITSFMQGYRQNVVLLGDDTEEISNLLEQYLENKKDARLTYVHASCVYAGPREFFKAVAFSLLSGFHHTTDSLDNLINRSADVLPATVLSIKESLQKTTISFLDVVEIINKFITESKRTCVFILEEFLGLSELFGDCYDDFSKFIILQRSCMIVLTTSQGKEADKVLSAQLNLLFGNFEKVAVNEHAPLDHFLYLRSLLAPSQPSPLFVSFIVNILGSNSLYYENMARIIRSKYREDDELHSLEEIIEEAM